MRAGRDYLQDVLRNEDTAEPRQVGLIQGGDEHGAAGLQDPDAGLDEELLVIYVLHYLRGYDPVELFTI